MGDAVPLSGSGTATETVPLGVPLRLSGEADRPQRQDSGLLCVTGVQGVWSPAAIFTSTSSESALPQ